MDPLGRTGAVVMVSPATTVIVNALVACTLAASVTCAVKLKLPALVGIPVMAPLVASNVRPAGKEPDVMDQRYGGVPPTAFRLAEYAVPMAPPDRVGAVVIVSAEITESVNAFVVLTELLSVTITVKAKLPKLVGVPVIAPLDGFSERPAGSEPALMDQV